MEQNSPQYIADLSMEPDLLDYEISKGLDVHATDINGNNALHALVYKIEYENTVGYEEAFNRMMEMTGFWDHRDEANFHRYIGEHYAAGEMLVRKYRVNPFHRNDEGKTPMDMNPLFLNGLKRELAVLGTLRVFMPDSNKQENHDRTTAMSLIARKLYEY